MVYHRNHSPVVAIDYDDTYDSAPQVWDRVIRELQDGGFNVIMVTFRPPDHPIEHDPGIPVVYTNGIYKSQYMQSLGLRVSIWIDDTPELIGKTLPTPKAGVTVRRKRPGSDLTELMDE